MVRSALLAVTFSFSAALLPYAQDPLQERLNAAGASRALRQAYFDANGEPPLTLELAFPHLAGAPLADPSFLAARGRTLAARRDACARERFDAGDGDRAEPVRAACDAEDAATALEERLLSALTVGLELAPGFADASVELARRPWREARDRASRMAEDDPDSPEAFHAAVAAMAAAETERQLLLYQSSALRRMTIPRDPTLGRLVEAELSGERDLAVDAPARDRLRRAVPLLGDVLSLRVESALESEMSNLPE